MHPSKYEIVLKVEETKSFTRTAEYFQYTQSAISQAVRSLESELNVTLFLRTPSGILLSDEGKYLFPSIREIVMGHRNLAERNGHLHNLQTGIIRLGGYLSVSWNFLPFVIKEFNKLYPNIKFELFQEDDLTLLENLQKGTIDIALMANPERRNYEYIELFKDDFFAILPNNHPLAHEKKISLESIQDEDFIFLEVGYSHYLKKMFEAISYSPNVKYRIVDDMTILSMVESGFGISILPGLATKRNPFLVSKVPITPSQCRHLGIITRKERYHSWAMHTFINYMQMNFEKFI